MSRVAGKIAIVTGAGSSGPGVGTGKAISILLAREGARVCLVDRVVERAEETLRLVTAEGGEAFAIDADVTDSGSCERVVGATVERFGPPNVLVNNVAARGQQIPIHLLDEAVWDEALAVNLKSAMLMCKFVLPHMMENGGGAIVNISSAAGMVSYGVPAYGAAKAGMLSLTRDLASMYAEHGIRANAICPGNIHTPMVGQTMKPEVRERRRLATPLGEGDSWDVGWTAVFLASDEADFITGQNIPVDGGVSSASRYNSAMW